MTKHQLAITILQPLLNISEEKAEIIASKNHGDYVSLMKKSKSQLEEMAVIAQRLHKTLKTGIVQK